MYADRFGTGLVFLAVLLVAVGLGSASCAREELSDQERHERMMELYAGYAAEFPEVVEITPLQAMEPGRDVLFVDVREPEEREVSLIPGALSEEEFLALDNVPDGRSLVAYCTIGYRSAEFARQMLEEKGLEVLNLQAGILGWVHAGGEIMNPAGESVKRIHVYGSTWNLAPHAYQGLW